MGIYADRLVRVEETSQVKYCSHDLGMLMWFQHSVSLCKNMLQQMGCCSYWYSDIKFLRRHSAEMILQKTPECSDLVLTGYLRKASSIDVFPLQIRKSREVRADGQGD